MARERRDINVDESGMLSTLGYMRRSGIERWRMELFGGSMNYDGAAQFDDGSSEPFSQAGGTNYLGVRGEYELLIEPTSQDYLRFYVGFGTRFWVRNLKDGILASGNPVMGYQECWWTFYPYIGFETRDPPDPGAHFYASARIGLTPLTYESCANYGLVLYPQCGLTAQAEFGIRFEKILIAASLEAMTWRASGPMRNRYQPDSSMYTAGAKIAYTF